MLSLVLSLAACRQPEVPCSGLDADGDGICEGQAVDWSEDAWLEPGTHRANLYSLDPQDLERVTQDGLAHAMVWPVTATGLRMPYRPLNELLTNPDNGTIQGLTRQVAGFGSMEELYERLGLPPIPDDGSVPLPLDLQPGDPMGAAVVDTEHGQALVFSCAACHAQELFGRTVMGLPNKNARPNAFFDLAAKVLPTVPSDVFQDLSGATDGEVFLYEEAVESMSWVGTRNPQVLGLDTSLAQVSLSLSKRGQDETASFDGQYHYTPRASILDDSVADSKTMPWWTMRYKTAWLADGSIVQGNPVLTNFLWNELGRGTDLEELETWLNDNQQVVDELTVAIFANEAPRWTDWFGTEGFELERLQAGHATYEQQCAGCHGSVEKVWEQAGAQDLPLEEKLATAALYYSPQTRPVDVGTDSSRAQGMRALEELNGLAISQSMGTVVRAGVGYVPPPLDGIWSRYPYLHNNAAPSLCELLTPAQERVVAYWQGPSRDPETDFDADCVGFPVRDQVPESWTLVEDAYFESAQPGLGNGGHDEMLYNDAGQLVVTGVVREDLILFLKTL
jgi:mono/diheme cytochrome c family protein